MEQKQLEGKPVILNRISREVYWALEAIVGTEWVS
jgi:hypothetical protein